MIYLQDLLLDIKSLKVGTRLHISGVLYTARDAAHKRIINILDNKKHLPFQLNNAAIYYCGPTPVNKNGLCACGPTTSARMDLFTPRILSEGVKFLIGKGARSDTVVNIIHKMSAVYFIATGGIAALLSTTIKRIDLIAFKDLGPEAIYRLEIYNMPLIVAIDSFGNNIFNKKR
ncbi:MAG: FumA C-terminus/TtdB family hydratase beta subunit [Endomicrobium sp.]|jgi:fumarate hydratase subunit beta|nr:FumA C-terminus/TtdB family hydratase beta subunit [Endomicrobium sp.]